RRQNRKRWTQGVTLMATEKTEVVVGGGAVAVGGNGEYGVEHIQHLQNAAHIRHRPGMYIGNTGASGLHHLVYELVYNSIDEALAGFCKNIHVVLNVDGSVSVKDDGRGIPVEEHPKEKKPTLEVVLTIV